MLTVLNVAYPFAEVGPSAVGGAEQVLAGLDAALTSAGHRSLVLACQGSAVTGDLISVDVPKGTITDRVRHAVARVYRDRILAILARHAVDVVHFHGVDCADYLPLDGPATIVTLHLSHHEYPAWLLAPETRVHLTCVSEDQRARLPPDVTVAAVIANGVDLQRIYPEATPRGGYAACLARICPEKGLDVALRAAHRADVDLRIAGRVFPYPSHQQYFASSIRPHLDERRRLVGPASGEEKRSFLANADCLIVPSQVDETSSLVTMEALAAGTPVIVSTRGALPSLVEPGVTGFIAPNEADIVQALERIGTLQRARCRASAETRFDSRRTSAEYLALYGRVAGNREHTRAASAGEAW